MRLGVDSTTRPDQPDELGSYAQFGLLLSTWQGYPVPSISYTPLLANHTGLPRFLTARPYHVPLIHSLSLIFGQFSPP